jgi:lipopolysaccharide transport system ATP-binding protein
MTVISVENLSKTYRLGQISSGTLFRDFERWLARVRGKPDPYARIGEADHGNRDGEELWALREVSFEVKQGEVLGIIGRNGAGKSTLLKILSRVTAPTSGQIKVRGRIASLLEVGTGFHPELTGRENIYLNGAILGMTRAEVRRKFDEIVDFAGVEQFIDTPVKRYSSGMYVRLAFAVAAHLEPEILVVDEVLAVGDAEFQKKCLGKMGEVAKGGRTVLFVSHNMGAVQALCPKTLLLRAGAFDFLDRSELVIKRYLESGAGDVLAFSCNPESRPQAVMVLTRTWIGDQHGKATSQIMALSRFTVGLEILVRRTMPGVEVSVRFYNSLGQPLFTSNLSDMLDANSVLQAGSQCFLIEIPVFLAPDIYSVYIGIHRPGIEFIDIHDSVLTFTVEETGTSMWQYKGLGYGNILVKVPWKYSGLHALHP